MASKEEGYAPGGNHYSGQRRIPNIKEFAASLDRDKKERDAAIDAEQKAKRDDTVKEHTNQEQTTAGNGREVMDPVTGNKIMIDDVNTDFEKAVENPHLSVPNANLGRETTLKTEHTQSGEEYRRNQDETAPPDPIANGATSDVPIHGEKTNILFHPTPAVSYDPMYAIIEQKATALGIGILVAIVFVGKLFGGSLLGLIPLGLCISCGVYLWMKDLVRQGQNHEWSSEQRRGETATANLIPESVEWMNTLLMIVWGLVNPEMFASVADTLEDVMQASVPGVIENVKVADISQGNNPIRILSLRALPDGHMQEVKDEMHKENAKVKDPQELAADEEGGDYYNLEASFAYHAKPSGESVSAKAQNMGMQLIFYLGMKGVFGVPLPIWVELIGLVGTVRIRLQMSPQPPFLKAVTFTLMGVPKVQAGCTPMIQRGVNILNLPLISNFVNWAVATACSMYVAPKSMTIDLSKMLQGDDVQKETNALGVLFIRIHKAVGLSKQDRRGSQGGGSDPYITVSFSKFGKPMYCTRVIQDTLNPFFEESCALLVTTDLIKADEQLSMELWDSDRSSADDVVGKVELSLHKLIQHPGKMYPQTSKLMGLKADSDMPGELHWEVGYFGKTQFRKALRTDGTDLSLPPELRNKPEFQDAKGTLDNDEEDAVTHTPPDPLWPSGILSVVVHQIVNLELENMSGSEGGKRKGGKEYEPARDAGEIKEEQAKQLPSAYCTILLNDQLIYKTRSKVVSSKPIYNAGTEKFIRDWRSTIVTVAVRDSRHRQHDPIIGVVPLKLSDILQTASQSSRWYPLDGGIGFGRIRISLLFRSAELKLPPPQLGWDVGTFEFTSDKVTSTFPTSGRTKLKMRTGGSTASIRREQCTAHDGSMEWDISGTNRHNTKPRMPIQYRYRSPIFFEVHQSGKRNVEHFAAVWLQDLVDGETQDFDVPIFKCNNGMRLSQNYITEANFKSIPELNVEEVGRLRFTGRFKAGTDRDHLRFVSDNDSRETIETWEACYAEGVRKEEVTKELPPTVKKLHEDSLTQGRDVLATASEEEKQKWLTKDGTDWTSAFGEDPAEFMNKRAGGDDDEDDEDQYEPDSESENSKKASTMDSIPEQGVKNESTDLGIHDADHGANGSSLKSTETNGTGASSNSAGEANRDSNSNNPYKMYKDYKTRSRDLHRQHRGLMQWRPMRNVQFAKDEALFAARRLSKVGSLSGRQPDVETEV